MPLIPRDAPALALALALLGCDEAPRHLTRSGLRVAPLPVPPPAPPADNELAREPGRVAGHAFFLSPAFASPDGAFDLVVHFHGAPPVVRAAFRRAELPAAVLLVNAGTGSTDYRRALFTDGRFDAWLRAVDEELERRGLRGPRRRRLALTSWSAGYGGVGEVLRRRPELVDAVVLLDGLHTHRDGPALARAPLEPFVTHARRARDRDAFFLLTHSAVSPEKPTTASTHRCADWLLRQLEISRFGRRDLVPAIAEAPRARPMRLQSDAREGGLVVQGYAGDEPEDHMAHLRQMAAIGLAELKHHWSAPEP